METGHRVAIVLTPIVAIATLAVGMRVGAQRTVHAAIVSEPRGRTEPARTPGRSSTLVEDQGTRETEPRSGITVHARSARRGRSDVARRHERRRRRRGAARLPGVERGDAIDLDVLRRRADRAAREGARRVGRRGVDERRAGPFVRSSKREGAIALDVAILGERARRARLRRRPRPRHVAQSTGTRSRTSRSPPIRSRSSR